VSVAKRMICVGLSTITGVSVAQHWNWLNIEPKKGKRKGTNKDPQ